MAQDKLNIQFRIKAVDNFSRNMNKLSQQLDKVQRKADELGTIENIKVGVTGDKKAKKDLESVQDKAEEVGRTSVWVSVKTTAVDAWNEYRRTMGKIATFSRNVGELVQTQMMSSFLVMTPTAVSGIASITAALGAMLPVIGTVSGGVLGLGSAFTSAGAGATAFGMLAVNALKDVFEVNEDISKLREELAQTDDLEERAEILEEIAKAYDSLSTEQQGAYDSMQSLKGAWDDLATSLQPQILTVFTNGMETLEGVLTRLEPMFTSVADTAVELSEAMMLNAEADDFNAFIDFLNTTAAPIMEDMAKAAGNFGMGFANMMAAFYPLASEMAGGLADMASRFREWTAGLSDSDKFNAFLDYVSANGPKLVAIVDNIVDGLVGMGEAFAPFASDMLDGFVEMTQAFEDWGESLSENKGFQEFIDYVTEEGPNFLAIMGELRDFLINIGKGFADVVEVMNPIIEAFLDFANTVMEGNPWIAQLVAIIASLAGVAGMLFPPFLLFKSIFGPLIMMFLTGVTNITSFWGALKMLLKFVPKTIGILVRFLGIWGVIISVILTVAGVIKENWDKIYNWSINTFGKIRNFIEEKFQQVQNIFYSALEFIDNITGGKFKSVTDTIRSYMETAEKIFTRTWDFLEDTLGNSLDFMKALLDGDFGKMKDLISDQLDNISDYFSDIWNDIVDFLSNLDFKQIGKDMMNGLKDGIKSVADDVVNSVKGVASDAIQGAKNLLGIASPSKVFEQIGVWTGEGFIGGMDKMVGKIGKTAEVMVDASVPKTAQYRSASFQSYPSQNGYETQPQVREGDTINIAPEATFIVREEADIERIKQELGNETKKVRRVRGEV